MNQPLFATYATDENRMSGSLMAVLQRVSLTTLQRLLSEATEEDVPLVAFRTQPKKPHGPGTPDAAITASVLYLVEVKAWAGSVDLEQLRRHVAWLDGTDVAHARRMCSPPTSAGPASSTPWSTTSGWCGSPSPGWTTPSQASSNCPSTRSANGNASCCASSPACSARRGWSAGSTQSCSPAGCRGRSTCSSACTTARLSGVS